ncbi:MAG: DNA (cytosine-5-)-methyltransferase [Flavobacteriaceae bacterium]|nr:DNA (cytosine-5-)-methyltransferase [Flavobacteriaceae bacterium]
MKTINKGINVLSLFDGMSCGQIALERLGIEVDNYFASEIDKYAIQVTQNNYPNTKQVGDIVNLKGSDLPKIDILYGGSPCQSFSRSGDGSGFDGKSKLFWEFVRILKEVNPKYFLLENVVMKKEWEDIITESLGVSPIKICSSNFSAQKRQRLYWTNIDVDTNIIDKGIYLSDIVRGNREEILDSPLVLDSYDDGSFKIKNATKKGFLIANNGDSVNLEVPNSKTRRGRVGIGKTNTLNTACNYGVIKDSKLVKLNVNDFEALQTVPKDYTSSVSDSQRKKMLGNGWTVDVIAHIFKKLKKK